MTLVGAKRLTKPGLTYRAVDERGGVRSGEGSAFGFDDLRRAGHA